MPKSGDGRLHSQPTGDKHGQDIDLTAFRSEAYLECIARLSAEQQIQLWNQTAIAKIHAFRNGGRVSREKFWIDGGSMFFALMYGKQALKLEKGMSTSKGSDLG